ncbi:MAG TPA: cytochrome b562 [Bdellovibrionales bacterium]|nr:cytochrome b562 [Bdellovibrionales bacterium]
MKALIAAVLISLCSLAAPAHEPAQPTLKQLMENMDKTYKALVRQINKPEMNASSIDMFRAFENDAYAGIPMLPASLTELTDVEKRKKQIVYHRLMTQLFNMCLEGEEALLNNNNAAAKSVLSKMAELKFQGHQIFKP